jgi:hypothetical protein
VTVTSARWLQVELGQGQVAGLGNLQINLRAGDDGNGMAGALDDGGFVGAEEAVGGGLGEGALEQAAAEALRGLGEDDEFAGDGGGDESAVGGALDLLDGVDGGQADDGGAVLDDGVDGAVDGGLVSMRGRTASWTRTMSSALSSAARAWATDSWRFSPPSTTWTRSRRIRRVLGDLGLHALDLAWRGRRRRWR